jgi:hypothetical protein
MIAGHQRAVFRLNQVRMCGVEHQAFWLGSNEHNNWLRNRRLLVFWGSVWMLLLDPTKLGMGCFSLMMEEAEACFVLPLRMGVARVAH